MARKYRHRGYKDDDAEEPSRRKPGRSHDVFRGRSEGRFREEVFRCHECSEKILGAQSIGQEDGCPKCGSDLHCCKNCRFFNPTAHRECQKDIPQRITRKALRNTCELFSPKIVLDLISSKSTTSADDARKAFENLFKK